MPNPLRNDVAQWSLVHWQEMFNDIYGKKNSILETNQLWYRMLEEIGELVVPMSNFSIRGIQWQTPDIFAWLNAATTRISPKKNLDDIVWMKFNDGCPGCGTVKDCKCPEIFEAMDKNPIKDNTVGQQKLIEKVKRPSTLDEWQKYFMILYGRRNSTTPPLNLLGKMIEDISSISRLVRQKRSIEGIYSKIASIFAWLMAICNRYSSMENDDTSMFRLSQITYEKYHDTCATCHKNPCVCPSPITTVFISWPKELREEKDFLEEQIKLKLGLGVISFPDFDVDVPYGIMTEAFRLLNQSDAAIILIGEKFSAPVYAELIEATYRLGSSSVFIGIKETDKREKNVQNLINEFSRTHIYDNYQTKEELSNSIIGRIRDSIERYNRSRKE